MKALLTALLIVSLPAAARATPDNQRFGGMVVFTPATGQDNTIAVWTGPVYGHSLFLEQLWGFIGIGYTAVGEKPGTGRDAISPMFGLELNLDLVSRLEVLARGVITINRDTSIPNKNIWSMEEVAVSAHAGLRFWFIEAFFSAGAGPAKGANIGLGVALTYPFGGGPDAPPAAETHFY